MTELAKLAMQAVRIHDYGGTDALVLEEAPRPEPQAGQVLVRVKAAGVNPVDTVFRGGALKERAPLQFPWTPGFEGAGVVEAVGADVPALQPEQEVYGYLTGAYAQYAVGKAQDLQSKPSNLTMEEAAAVPMGAGVAWAAVVEAAGVEEGQSVLIHGAAGGVGAFATQLAHWKQAYVIGTASKENLRFVRSLGAQLAADYRETPFEAVVGDVDVVIDTVGGDVLDRSWAVVRPGGILVTVAGRLSLEAGQAQGIRTVSVMRPPFADYKQISEMLQAKTLAPTVRAVFPLAEARAAEELSETRHGRGRIVLQIP